MGTKENISKTANELWQFISAERGYSHNLDYYLKTIAFLAYITNENKKKIVIDFKEHSAFNHGMEKLFRLYDGDYRIQNTLIEIIKASQINHEDLGKAADRLYKHLLEQEYETQLYVFEYMDDTTNASKNGLGFNECITNKELARVSLNLFDNNKNKKICDPACGRGVFLGEYVKEHKNVSVKGFDIEFMSTLLCRMRLIMLGVKDFDIVQSNVLYYEVKEDETYGNVFLDFPWMVKSDSNKIETKSRIDLPIASSTRSDWKFVKAALNMVSQNCKLIAVMNEGSLYNTIDTESRKFLIENGYIETIISMPQGTLLNTGAQYSLVVFSKNNKSVKYVDATSQFETIKRIKIVNVDGVLKLVNSSTKYTKEADIKAIREQNYNLSYGRYIKTKNIKLTNPTKIKEFAEVFRGYQISSSQIDNLIAEKEKGEYELLQLSNVENGEISDKLITISSPSKVIDKFLLKNDDIIISSKSTNIKIAIVDGVEKRKVFPAGSILVIRANQRKINPKYLKVFLDSNTGRSLLNSIQTGAVIVSINASALLEMEVSLPSLKEQERIADKYDELSFNYKSAVISANKIKDKLNGLYESEMGDK